MVFYLPVLCCVSLGKNKANLCIYIFILSHAADFFIRHVELKSLQFLHLPAQQERKMSAGGLLLCILWAAIWVTSASFAPLNFMQLGGEGVTGLSQPHTRSFILALHLGLVQLSSGELWGFLFGIKSLEPGAFKGNRSTEKFKKKTFYSGRGRKKSLLTSADDPFIKTKQSVQPISPTLSQTGLTFNSREAGDGPFGLWVIRIRGE